MSTGLGSIQRAVRDYAEETSRRLHHGWIGIEEVNDPPGVIPVGPLSPATYESVRRAIGTLVERDILQKRRSPDGRRIEFRASSLRDHGVRPVPLRDVARQLNLDGADFSRMDFRYIKDLSNRSLRGANLSGSDLRGVDFANSDLSDACLFGCGDMSGATLRDHAREKIRITRTDLRFVDLRRAAKRTLNFEQARCDLTTLGITLAKPWPP